MERKLVLNYLRKAKASFREKYRVKKIGIFGSYARNKFTEKSDLDVVVVLEKQDLFDLIGIKQELEEKFQIQVDVVSYRERMNSFLKKRIEREVVYV